MITSVFGGVQAGIIAAGGIVFFVTDKWVNLGDWFPVISGVALIVTLMRHPEGIASGGHELAHKVEGVAHRSGRRPTGVDGRRRRPRPQERLR